MTAIRVENLSKRYRLGVTHAGSVRELANRLAGTLLGRKKSTSHNSLPVDAKRVDDQGYFWALRNLSFSIEPGEVVGIIGKNGSGKSTLLKILSRISGPTSGRITLRGRVASLLEVGTGFHPELTGRENIYLNGTILGMTRREISRQFAAIVDFAGVEKFIDTPVKRYSSGMTVRLGFAVAAHLNPEILIVDEVLAVGDAEFQQKCMGKMNSVAASGRTILFVSHNMSAVGQLCETGLFLSQGFSTGTLPIRQAIELYLNQGDTSEVPGVYLAEGVTPPRHFSISRIAVSQDQKMGQSAVMHDRNIDIDFTLRFHETLRRTLRLSVAVCDNGMRKVFTSTAEIPPQITSTLVARMTISRRFLLPGAYSLIAGLLEGNGEPLDVHRFVCKFHVENAGDEMRINPNLDYGVVFDSCAWSFTKC